MEQEEFVITETKVDENTYDLVIENKKETPDISAYERLVNAVNYFLKQNKIKNPNISK